MSQCLQLTTHAFTPIFAARLVRLISTHQIVTELSLGMHAAVAGQPGWKTACMPGILRKFSARHLNTLSFFTNYELRMLITF
jgi:hypothetical protein